MKVYGFNKAYKLKSGENYEGSADVVMLVWHENQILPAEQYRKAKFPDKTADIAVCQDPNVQKVKLGERAVIYKF